MSNIALKTTGIRGEEPQYEEKIGRVVTFLRHGQDYITIDDFEGSGDTYKQRELTNIEIVHNGELLFSGDKYDLYQILRKCKQDI